LHGVVPDNVSLLGLVLSLCPFLLTIVHIYESKSVL
jgi:hypothetical protein